MVRKAALCLALAVIMGVFSQCSPAATNLQNEDSAPAKIQLMTSLPIVWGEGASMESIVSGETSPAPIYAHWQRHHDISAVDSFAGLENSDTDLILLAQPPAMDPADIAAVDAWVRAGGKAIILTDPMLVWHTEFPIGDNRRPLASGLLSPLLGHWGLELLAPDGEGAGGVELEFSSAKISTVGIGTFKAAAEREDSHADCAFSTGNVMARCSVGKGAVIIVADADFLNDALWSNQAGKDTGDARELTDSLIADLQK